MTELAHISPETQDALDLSWLLYIERDYKNLKSSFNQYIDSLDLKYGRKVISNEDIKEAKHFRSHKYQELENIPSRVRTEFKLMSGWRRLFSDKLMFNALYSYSWGDAFASFLPCSYELNADISKMYPVGVVHDPQRIDEIRIALQAPYMDIEGRISVWPLLKDVFELSLTARILFLRIIRYVDLKSNLARDISCVPFGVPLYQEAVRELEENKIIDSNPGLDALLMLASAKDIKNFAFERGIKHTGVKYQVAERVMEKADSQEINEFVKPRLDWNYYHLLISNVPALKKFIYQELDRFDPYIEWIYDVYTGNAEEYTEEQVKWSIEAKEYQAKKDERIDHLSPWGNNSSKYRPLDYLKEPWSQPEIRILKDKLWSEECDALLPGLVKKYAWDASWFVVDAVKKVVSPEQLSAFQKDCDRYNTRAWHDVIKRFGDARISELRIRSRRPRRKKCLACGVTFKEWSLPPDLASAVYHDPSFCSTCSAKALKPYNRENITLSEEVMIDRLINLSLALEIVPLATFMKKPIIDGMPKNKQKDVINALINQPTYDKYVSVFGNWLQALTNAGIIEAGTLPGPRGIRCIAKDGHECFSLAEKSIDDWLTDHGIQHEKEPLYPPHQKINPSGRMRADWKVNDILIEYVGLLDDPEYKAKVDSKRELAKEFLIQVIFIEPKDILDLSKILKLLK